MQENFDLQNYLAKGIERVVSEALKATLKNPKESTFMLKFSAASRAASKKTQNCRRPWRTYSFIFDCKYHESMQSALCGMLFKV